MNYTEKYHLPQWEENDRVMRTDFNQMCVDIESAFEEADAKAQKLAAEDKKLAKQIILDDDAYKIKMPLFESE